MIAITPAMFAGTPRDVVWFDDLVWAETPEEAFQVIRHDGRSALLDVDNWQDQAGEVLKLLVADTDHITGALSTAARVNERPEDCWPDTLPSGL